MDDLKAWDFRRADGKAAGIFLGYRDSRPVGITDDRHILTVAGSRSGKGVSLIIPNLLLYDGSVLAIDPKGELAALTFGARTEKDQSCFALDPFGVSGQPCARFNPLDEIDPESDFAVDDAGNLAGALIATPERGERHWSDSARELVRALILLVLTFPKSERDLLAVRQLLTLSAPEFHSIGAPEARRQALFDTMQKCTQYAVVRRAGFSFAAVEERELSGIFSTARTQTQFLDSPHIARVLAAGSAPQFRLSDLKAKKTTIYLCLPAGRMGEFAPWLRLIIDLALVSFERERQITPDIPVLVVMDEFPVLGHMKSIEVAAGQIAGFGVRLWTVLQDLTQISRIYKESWQTFIGNAGILTFFGNTDEMTLGFVSRKLGTRTMIVEEPSNATFQARLSGAPPTNRQMRSAPLLSPAEVEQVLSRQKGRVLVFASGLPPVILKRAFYYDPADPLLAADRK
ncbi:type IV secretory system conjugative DNA transfer family protein [Rhodomicrobium vannielii ATCC 17100]|nr:type IV secretory system conjugative DNA transfer family protein [Rhodomicrobium vannielii ATCC 17100]